MTIEPDRWLFPGCKVSVPDSMSSERVSYFAERLKRWADAKSAAEAKARQADRKLESLARGIQQGAA